MRRTKQNRARAGGHHGKKRGAGAVQGTQKKKPPERRTTRLTIRKKRGGRKTSYYIWGRRFMRLSQTKTNLPKIKTTWNCTGDGKKEKMGTCAKGNN